MHDELYSTLKKVVDSPSPSGFEQPVQSFVRSLLSGLADEVTIDVHGNLSAILNPGGRPRVMIAAHCDEIGFMVRYIDENGFIYFSSIGGIDPHVVPGHRVHIHGRSQTVLGTIGRKPIHALEEEERKKLSKLDDMWIDIGAPDKKAASEFVAVGDAITFATTIERFIGRYVVSRGLDDKVGTVLLCEVIKRLAKEKVSAAVYATSTVQEEIGLRGARTAAFALDPDIGIAIDVDLATDFPGMEMKKNGEVRLGKGPVICRGPNINPKVERLLIDAAEQDSIPYQISGASRATPTDANVIQISRAGVAAGLVSIPCRYLHTPAEVINLDDLEHAVQLLCAFLRRLTSKDSFLPLENW